ncbi:MAG: phosphate ABC transporter permease PstA [Saccharospirillum sp.]
MNDTNERDPVSRKLARARDARLEDSLRRRHHRERWFRWGGLGAVCLALGFLAVLLVTLVSQGMTAFYSSYVRLNLSVNATELAQTETEREQLALYQRWLDEALAQALAGVGDAVGYRAERQALVSASALYQVREALNDQAVNRTEPMALWLLASDEVDLLVTGVVDRQWPEAARQLNDRQLGWVEQLQSSGRLERRFNWAFFTGADSSDPETAGIWGALVGSFLTLAVTLTLAFPVGVATAIYLEEFAPRNRLTDIIELSINNLAAVPSIIFGLLGLAVFINTLGMPRSAPLVGGMVLALITLPTIIIATRSALRAVPESLRDAARGMGASPLQVTFHHVVPMAMPGILTGTIIGLAQALGETAPLLMIGMVAFIADVPSSLTDPATVLPVQIFMWSDSPERAFIAKTSAAILVLLGFLALMNLSAVLLRRRYERRLK